ncbi:MAG: SO_0444 family Cu/Zn efflux transporter [Clostridia bacterium]|jgi:uncharacterized membrane protein YraQ (UPF0718 family)/copper chaperone CopZ|nr:SO_0444 family Cu/Zn efflux transporter [Clostridia bacterium]
MILDLLKEILFIFLEISPYMLLGLFLVGLLHMFFSKEFVSKHIGTDNVSSVIKSSVLGVPLPLCSCGVIPTAVYLAKNGASKGAVVSFLISTPQTGIDSIIATYGILGPISAIYRPIVAFISGITGGIIVLLFAKDSKLNIETEEIHSCHGGSCGSHKEEEKKSFFNYAFVEFLDDISSHFIVGTIIAGLISFFLPAEFLIKYNLTSGIHTMVLMVLVGIPMYICATSSLPIAAALIAKGISPGTAFVFLAAGPVTNIASIAVLSKVLPKKILTIFISVSSILAILFGLLLDFILIRFNIVINPFIHMHNHSDNYLSLISGIVFGLLLVSSMYRKYFKKDHIESDVSIEVEGMTCNHCANNVKSSLEKLKGVNSVNVNLASGMVHIKGVKLDTELLAKSINNLGYKAKN